MISFNIFKMIEVQKLKFVFTLLNNLERRDEDCF